MISKHKHKKKPAPLTPNLLSPSTSTFYIPKQDEFQPFSNFSQFNKTNQNFSIGNYTKLSANQSLILKQDSAIITPLSKSKPKNINYFRKILSYSKQLPDKYNKDNVLSKISNRFKILTKDFKYNDSIIVGNSNTCSTGNVTQLQCPSKTYQNEINDNNNNIIRKPSYIGMDVSKVESYYKRIESSNKKQNFVFTGNNNNTNNNTWRTDSVINSINLASSVDYNKQKTFLSKNSNGTPLETEACLIRKNRKIKRNLIQNLLFKNTKAQNNILNSPLSSTTTKQFIPNAKLYYPTIQSYNNNNNSSSRNKKVKRQLKLLNDDKPAENIINNINNNNNYIIAETYSSINGKLSQEIKKIIANSNTVNNPLSNHNQSIPNQLTNYASELISKIKKIKTFISKQPLKYFQPKHQRHKIVYVIIDGSVIISQQHIPGEFIEIPNRRYLSLLNTKKERLEKYYEFLTKCKDIFNSKIPFTHVFLLNGIPIFDLIDIPDDDNCIYISKTMLCQGIHIFKEEKITKSKLQTENIIEEEDLKLLKFKPAKRIKVEKFDLAKFIRKRKKQKINNIESKLKLFKTIKKQKQYINDQSFTAGYSDKHINEYEEYKYYSDDNHKRRKIPNYLSLTYPSKLSSVIHLHTMQLNDKIKELIKRKDNKIKHIYSTRPNESTIKGLNKLIQIYNELRSKRYNITIHQHKRPHKNRTVEEEIHDNEIAMMKCFLKKMKLFRIPIDNGIEFNSDLFQQNKQKQNTYVYKNIRNAHNFISFSEYKIEKYYPDLISFNIPHFLNAFPKLKRRELFEIFVEFKTLLKICVIINKNLKLIKEGIDFDTFYNCILQMNSQGKEMTKKIFNTINTLNSKYVNWEELMNGLLTLKNKDLNDKLDLFLRIIDSDGNGYLSFEEVYSLSIDSLSRQLSKGKEMNENDIVITLLADYFAKLIFQLVGRPINEEIPITEIKAKIYEGGQAAEYLQMFICADNFL